MSVVMAIRDSGRVWMAADTQVSCEGLKFYTVSETNYKISKLPDGILVGFSGDVRIRNLLVAHSEWFGKLPRSGLTKRFLVTRIVPRLLWLCKENGLLVEESQPRAVMEGDFLFAWRDRLFQLQRDFSVWVVAEKGSIGAGGTFSDAALMDTTQNLTVRERLLGGLRLAAYYSIYVDRPFLLINTEQLEYELEDTNDFN